MFKSIVAAVKRLDAAIKETLVQHSRNVAEAVWNEFGDECTMENAEAVAKAIAAESTWKGTSSAGARKSEWKAFVYAVQYHMLEAVNYYQKTYPNFNRHVMFTLARELPRNPNGFKAAADAVAKRVKKASKGSNGATRTPTIGMAIGIIKNLPSRGKITAFRKELAALCAKYKITY